MRRHAGSVFCLAAATLIGAAPPAASAQGARAELARARVHYNAGQYDAAIDVARVARRLPETADAACIVLARAHLERYRAGADPADLSAAREALGLVRPDALTARDRVEWMLALGQALFLEDEFGAAAVTFESGLDRAAAVDATLADAMLEWWGSALERHAADLTRAERVAAFGRLADWTRGAMVRDPHSAAAAYWRVVALRGEGHLDDAWDAAVAGWARARLMGERAAALRDDLNKIVLEGILPDRVRGLTGDERAATESQLRAEWELVKEKWR